MLNFFKNDALYPFNIQSRNFNAMFIMKTKAENYGDRRKTNC